MKVNFTDSVREELIVIGNRIAENDPWRALSFVEELETRRYGIADSPRAFPLLPKHEQSGIRRVVHGNYNIFYSLTDTINILHILNSAMDYERILFPDE
jgi:toxin ParE1/3/4